MRRSTAAAALIPCALALTLAGCSSSAKSSSTPTGAAQTTTAASPSPTASPNTHLSSSQLNDDLGQAVKNATALKMKGSIEQDGQQISVDLQVNADSGGGTIGANGISIPIRLVDGVSYMQMTPDVIKGLIEKSAPAKDDQMLEQLLTNKWISSSSSSGKDMTQSFAQFLDLKKMTDNLVSGPSDTFTYIGTGTVDGQQVAKYKDVSSDSSTPESVMSIPLYGPTLPVLEDAGSKGTVTMVWNKPVPVAAPPADQIVTLPAS